MAYPSDKDILKLIKNDPIKNAEELTGKNTEDDEATMKLGFMMNLYDGMIKEQALKAVGDTVFHMDWLAYCEMIETFGFGLMIEDFSPDGGAAIRIYYNEKDGVLLRTDSTRGNRNSASIYYNWQPNIAPKEEWYDENVPQLVTYWDVTGSGGFYYPNHDRFEIPDDPSDPAWKEIVWAGDNDAREAVGFRMRRLREMGTFVPVWKECPYLWLVGHWEHDDKADYKEITNNRVIRLPQWVQDNIKGIK